MKLGIGKKIGIGLAVLFILICLLSVVSIYNQRSMKHDFSDIIDMGMPALESINDLARTVSILFAEYRDYLSTKYHPHKEEYLETKNKFETLISNFIEFINKNRGEHIEEEFKGLEKIGEEIRVWHEDVALPTFALAEKAAKYEIESKRLNQMISEERGKKIFDRIRVIIDAMIKDFEVDGNIVGANYVRSIQKSLIDRETGQRGFLITGKESFLEPYEQGAIDFNDVAGEIKDLVAKAHDREKAEENIKKLKQLELEWKAKAGNAEIELRRKFDKKEIPFKDIEDELRKETGKSIIDSMRRVMDEMEREFKVAQNDKALSLVILASKGMVEQETGQRGFIITGEESFLEPYKSGEKIFDKALADLQTLNSNAYNISLMKKNLDKVVELSKAWTEQAASKAIALRRELNNDRTYVDRLNKIIQANESEKIQDSVYQHLMNLKKIEGTEIKASYLDASDLAERSGIITYILLFVSIVICLAVVVFINMIITRPVIKLSQAINKVAEGNLEIRVNLSSADEIGSMGTSFNQMAEKLYSQNELNQKRSWTNDGIQKVNDLLRVEKDVEAMGNNICSFLAEYIGVRVASFYILIDNELRLKGSYAFTKRKNSSTVIRVGEGFVGQAAREKKPISVTDIPADYTRISSSTGGLEPFNIVAQPFVYSDRVYGVIEVGSFEELDDTKLEFLELVSSPIAVSIYNVQAESELQELLKISEEKSQELQVQQEELRSSNETLEAKTRELQQSEEELKQQSEELKVSNEELEEKTNYLEAQKKEIEEQNRKIKITREEIRKKAEELEVVSKYKSEFLANMSHELRTPLNSMLILSKMFTENDDGNLTEEQIEQAQIIHKGGKDLLNLINDILDLSKIEAGKMEMIYENVDVEDIISSLKDVFIPIATNKNLEFIINAEPSLPDKFTSDSQRLKQILKNLLGNSFKFTEQGKVELKIFTPKEAVDNLGHIMEPGTAIGFAVSDTGIGIPEDKKKLIFEAFQQAEGSIQRKHGGTGLGLTISRELVKKLGGKFEMTSEEGKGSTFTIYLPLEGGKEAKSDSTGKQKTVKLESGKIARPEPAEVEAVTSEIPRTEIPTGEVDDDRASITDEDEVVLIIEDDRHFSRTLANIVRKRNFKAICSHTGRDGLQLAVQYNPSGIVLDLGLPDVDGEFVLKKLKANLRTRHIPVHILSARELNSEFLNKGAIGYLEKPVSSEQVFDAIEKIHKIHNTSIKNILVVEDDKSTQSAVKKLLKNQNINITPRGNASDALKVLGEEQGVDCIILDLNLPDMTGFEFIKKAKEKLHENMPPVVVYTGRELTKEEYGELRQTTASIVIKSAESPERLLDEVTLFLHSVEESMPEFQKKMIRSLYDKADVSLNGKTVMIVDDDMRNLYSLSAVLQKKGMKVMAAPDGKTAQEKFASEYKNVDIILMDIMMPVQDGFQTMKNIRAQEFGKKVPMIAVTAKAMKGDREKCIESGANDYISKPVDVEKLLSLMKVWLTAK